MFHRLICNIKDNIGSSLCIVSFDIRRISNCGNNRSIAICMEFFFTIKSIFRYFRTICKTRCSIFTSRYQILHLRFRECNPDRKTNWIYSSNKSKLIIVPYNIWVCSK